MFGSQSEDWSRWLGARGHWPQLLPPAMSVINTDNNTGGGENISDYQKYFAYFEHGENNMGPHVRIPFIDFMSNGGERSETFNLREIR